MQPPAPLVRPNKVASVAMEQAVRARSSAEEMETSLSEDPACPHSREAPDSVPATEAMEAAAGVPIPVAAVEQDFPAAEAAAS